ncbi:unnamed protein product [Closterium sp. NIES-53]
MALRPSSVPPRVPLPSPPASSLADGPDPESDLVRAARPTVPRLLAAVVSDPSLESSTASALVAELIEFAAACCLDYATSLVAESESDLWQLVYDLRQAPREWHDTLRMMLAALGFAPWTTASSLFLRTDTSLSPFYVLVYVDDLVFATADTEALALVESELQKRHTCTDLGELRSYLGLQITWDRARRTITLTQSHMVHQVLQRFGFRYSSPQSTPLPTGHSLSAPPSDESVELSGPYPELVGCLMYLMTCTRPDLAYPLSILARYVAPGRHRPEHWEAAKRVLRYLCSTSGMGLVLGGRGPVPCAAPPCPAHFPSARASPCQSRHPCLHAALLVARHLALPTMASLSVLTFDHEGRPIQFDTWLDDLQLYLLSDSRDSVSLFDNTSGASLAPPPTADSATRSLWLTHDAAGRLAVRNHLPLAERAHFGQHKTA